MIWENDSVLTEAVLARRARYCVGHVQGFDVVSLESDDELSLTQVHVDGQNEVVGMSYTAWEALEADPEALEAFAADLASSWDGEILDLSSKDYFLTAYAAFLEGDEPMDRLRDLQERLQGLVISSSGVEAIDPRDFAERKVQAQLDLLALQHEMRKAEQLLAMLED
jgi:hypothetical protein